MKVKFDDFVAGSPMKDLYDAWLVEYNADPASGATADKFNTYRVKENERLMEVTFPQAHKDAIRAVYDAERA